MGIFEGAVAAYPFLTDEKEAKVGLLFIKGYLSRGNEEMTIFVKNLLEEKSNPNETQAKRLEELRKALESAQKKEEPSKPSLDTKRKILKSINLAETYI